jgi:hypothetical protein
MTYFVMTDEARDRFAPIQRDRRTHADAVTLYTFLGQACARRMTDGERIDDLTIAGELPGWNRKQRRRASDALVKLGLWRSEGDQWAFVDWDEHQTTREQELARRQRGRDRKRDYRARCASKQQNASENDQFLERSGVYSIVGLNDAPPETIQESPNVPWDVPRDVPVPSASASPLSLFEREIRGEEELSVADAPARRPLIEAALPKPPKAEPAPKPNLKAELAELAQFFGDPALLEEARTACALSRRSGTMSDPVWAATLRKLRALGDPAPALGAMRIFVDSYADGDKNERYMLVVAQNIAKRGPGGVPGMRKAMPTGRVYAGVSDEEYQQGEDMVAGWARAIAERDARKAAS